MAKNCCRPESVPLICNVSLEEKSSFSNCLDFCAFDEPQNFKISNIIIDIIEVANSIGMKMKLGEILNAMKY